MRGRCVKGEKISSYVGALALCGTVALAGCGLMGSERATPGRVDRSGEAPARMGSSRSDETPLPQRSPQQIAALHRMKEAEELIAGGRYRLAIAHLEKTLALDSTNPQIYFHLARAHHGLSNYDESLHFLEVAESLSSAQGALLSDILVLKGDTLQRLGQPGQARRSYERALAVDPGNDEAAGRLRLVARPS